MSENKIAFLEKALDDAQELIRFLDAKTAIVITIFGSYILGLLFACDNIVTYWNYYSRCFCLLLFLLILSISICILMVKRIIRPTNDPSKNINLSNETPPILLFYLTQNTYKWYYPFLNSEHHKLTTSFSTFYNQVKDADESEIIKSLAFEVTKVNFIRNIKNDRFKLLVRGLIITTVLFVVTYGFYSFETQNAKEILEIIKNYSKSCH